MIAYRLFLLFDWCLMHLPRSWRKSLFISLASLAHLLAASRNRIIQANLDFAFGDTLSTQTKKEIELYCYSNLALNFLQTMENRRNSAEEIASIVTFENRSMVDDLLAQGKGIIFVSGHFGNWELGGAALSSLITPVSSIYKGFERKEFDPYLKEARMSHRMELAEKSGALKHMAKALKSKRSILLMIDQSSTKKYGIKVDFFSHPTYHTASAAALSHKFDAPIVGVYIFEDHNNHYTIQFTDPIILPDGSSESIMEATQTQVKALEAMIKERPELWFWCHQRWKTEWKEIMKDKPS